MQRLLTKDWSRNNPAGGGIIVGRVPGFRSFAGAESVAEYREEKPRYLLKHRLKQCRQSFLR